MDSSFLKNHKFSFLLLLSGAAFYISFGYDLQRTDFVKLITLYSALFIISWKLYTFEKTNFRFLVGIAIFFRLLFLFSLPNLSQDFYRFIWDGRMLLEGFNPYLTTPDEFFLMGRTITGANELISGMGALSAGNYTSYPPLNQLIFGISTFLTGKSILGAVIVMRLFITAADIGVLYFGRKLLRTLNLPEKRSFWYFLNPFIIIELTGNLHFEGVVLFFLIWSIYLLHQNKWLKSAILMAGAIAVKLIPLLFLPLLFRRFSIKRLLGYYLIIGLICLLFFAPIISAEFLANFSASIRLWFQKFEFNASIFYLIRWIGFQFSGYNIIGYAGPIMAVVVFFFIIWLALIRKNISTSWLLKIMLFAITFYFLLSTTVHPWYLATPLLLCIFTKYRFPLVWSFFAVLSYKAYSNKNFEENLWLIVLEYIVVFALMIYEIYKIEFQKKPAVEKS